MMQLGLAVVFGFGGTSFFVFRPDAFQADVGNAQERALARCGRCDDVDDEAWGLYLAIFKVGMCLPAGPYVTDSDVAYIVESIKEAME